MTVAIVETPKKEFFTAIIGTSGDTIGYKVEISAEVDMITLKNIHLSIIFYTSRPNPCVVWKVWKQKKIENSSLDTSRFSIATDSSSCRRALVYGNYQHVFDQSAPFSIITQQSNRRRDRLWHIWLWKESRHHSDMNNLTGERVTKSLGIKGKSAKRATWKCKCDYIYSMCVFFAWIPPALMHVWHFVAFFSIAIHNETHSRQQQALTTRPSRWPWLFVVSRSVHV